MTRPLALLHLSDIHFAVQPSKGWANLDADLRQALERDLETLLQELGVRLDIIAVTGDITFRGDVAEFLDAESWLRSIGSRYGEEPTLLTVPGNHDVQRGIVSSHPAVAGCHRELRDSGEDPSPVLERWSTSKIVVENGGKERSVGPLLAGHLNYNEFAARLGCAVTDTAPFWEREFHHGGTRFRFRGLTSTIVSDEHDDDRANAMIIGERQVQVPFEPGVVNIAMIHHPPGRWWLDDDNVVDSYESRFHVRMSGHKHRFKFAPQVNGLGIVAGATHPSRRERDWVPRYSVVLFQPTGDQVTVDVRLHSRVWSGTDAVFQRDQGVGPDGSKSHIIRAGEPANRVHAQQDPPKPSPSFRDHLHMMVPSGFVGRAPQLHRGFRVLRSLGGGSHPRVLVLSGGPGVGKTSLALQLATDVSETSAQNIEQIVRFPPVAELSEGSFRRWLVAICGWAGLTHSQDDVHRVLAALGARRRGLEPSVDGGLSSRRNLLVGAVEALRDASLDRRVVLVLDDLQNAGGDALALIETILEAELPNVILICTRRVSGTVEQNLAQLLAVPWVREIRVEGLNREETAEFLNNIGITAMPDDLHELIRLTGGSPIDILAFAETVPAGASIAELDLGQVDVGDLLERKVRGAGQGATPVAAVAAALGIEFSRSMITSVADRLTLDAREGINALMTHGLLREQGFDGELLAFRHELYWEAANRVLMGSHASLLPDLAMALRETWESQERPQQLLVKVAELYRLVAGRDSSFFEEAALLSVLEAEYHLGELRYEDALATASGAFASPTSAPIQIRARAAHIRADSLVRLGRLDEAGIAFRRVATLLIEGPETLTAGESRLLAEAISGLEDTSSNSNATNDEIVEITNRAIGRLPEDAFGALALCQAVLAIEIERSDRSAFRPKAETALHLGMGSGDDSIVARMAIVTDTMRWRYANSDERIGNIQEGCRRAEADGAVLLRVELLLRRLWCEVEANRVNEANETLRLVEEIGEAQNLLMCRWHVAKHRAGISLASASLKPTSDGVAQAIDDALRLGEELQHPDSFNSWAIQSFFLGWRLDRSSEQVPYFQAAVNEHMLPSWRANYALGMYELGNASEASKQLSILEDSGPVAALSEDGAWAVCYAAIAETAVYLQRESMARSVQRVFEPHSGKMVVAGNTSVNFGPVDFFLAMIDGMLGDYLAAEHRFLSAIAQTELSGSVNLTAYAQAYLADLIDFAGSSQTGTDAAELRLLSRQTADEHGLVRLSRQLEGECPHFR